MIHERSTARRIALQGLYQLDVQGEPFLIDGLQAFVSEATDDPRIREIAYFMAKSAWMYHPTADEWIGRIAAKWPVYRMATVDRNILRLAAWELVNYTQTPPKVVLDEAITMGKEFSTAESGNFINGILDAMLKEHVAQTGRSV
ncbi:MAG TPA: transcription antitermination factor NusB [Phycisphaerae bacterium]|nr:transcription antitermination factor NusB [Phycisphaerae bacterium]